METVNSILERAQKLREDAIPPEEKARWIMELDGKIRREVIDKHHRNEGETETKGPRLWPEDGGKPLAVDFPDSEIYVLYVFARCDFIVRDGNYYNESATAFNDAYENFAKEYHRTHRPKGANRIINLWR